MSSPTERSEVTRTQDATHASSRQGADIAIALGVWEQDFINGVVSDGDWAPNDQIGRLDG